MDPEIQESLEPGERVLWSGRPRRGLTLRPQDGFLIPFSLVWTAIAATGFIAGQKAPNTPMAVVPALFLVIGAYFVVGRFFVDAWLRARTRYAVTNVRVIIISGFWSRETRSLSLDGLSDMRVTKGRNGRGTIRFGADSPGSGRFNFTFTSSSGAAPSFEGIDDVADVERTIRKAQQAASRDD
jgi:hypothetical protein